MSESTKERLLRVRERLRKAEEQAGRAPGSVQLMAVSKRHPVAKIREAYLAGQRLFGENYVQEISEKAAELSDLSDLRIHMIGHLQTNKAKRVAELAHGVGAVDSPRLAQALQKRALAAGRELEVYVAVNTSNEPQKSGVRPDELSGLVALVREQSQLRLAGLMTMPPLSASPEAAAPYFQRLAQLRTEVQAPGENLLLNMGMSADLEVAVAHGADVVRVGTAIFGPRPA